LMRRVFGTLMSSGDRERLMPGLNMETGEFTPPTSVEQT